MYVSLALLLLACRPDGDTSAATRSSLKIPSLQAGAAAPAYRIAALDGRDIAFGGDSTHVTLLNVWATWCASCREEFAELERLRGVYESRGLSVVAVSVDQGSDRKVRAFVAQQGSRFPVAHDRDGRISSLYAVKGLPATYLIDATGKVRWTLTGSFLLDSAGLVHAIESTMN